MENKIISWDLLAAAKQPRKKSGPAFSLVEGSRVIAVMSRSEDKVRSYAERHNIPKWYTDAQQLIDDPRRKRRLYCHTSFHACYLCNHDFEIW